MFKDLVKSTRSYRNFRSDVRFTREDLTALIELCRFTPATANRQPLKFGFAYGEKACEEIFPLLGWAGYLTEKPPFPGNEPTAYILICYDTDILQAAEVDVGICAQTIVLGAMEKGIGACMIGSFSKEKIAGIFGLPSNIVPRLIIALGAPNEKIVLTDAQNGEIKYFRDSEGTHFVPKRPLDEILLPSIE